MVFAAALFFGAPADSDVIAPSTKVTPSNAASLGFEVYFGPCGEDGNFCEVYVRVPSHVHSATWHVPDRKHGESFVQLHIVNLPETQTLQGASPAYARFFAKGFRGLELNISKNHIATTSFSFVTLEDPSSGGSGTKMHWDFGSLQQWVSGK